MIDLKAVAQQILKAANDNKRKSGLSVADMGYVEGQLDTAQLFLKYILRNEQGDNAMIKNELTFKRVRLEDIVTKDRGPSKFEAQIVELAKDLRPGEAEQINPERGMQYGNFNTRISKMRIANKLSDDITTKKSGDAMFLVRLPEGQKVRQVVRRSKQQIDGGTQQVSRS